MNYFRKIHAVKAKIPYKVICTMENGEVYEYDLSHLKDCDGEMVIPLKDPSFFARVGLDENGHLLWPNGFDIHASTVAEYGSLISQKEA